MGYTSYSYEDRLSRSVSSGFSTVTKATADTVFKQNKLGMIHEEMKPSKAQLRESRDSDTHPNTVPIIIGLDETGSMGDIPIHMVKDGLPKMVSKIIQNGIPDPQILFLGIGDHEVDDAPLQVGQFESGDAELDLWLTRTWNERGGGSNAGESYLLAWYFAAKHTIHDCNEKRGQKGILFTIGDEPNLPRLPSRSIEEIMGVPSQSSYTDSELLALAQETYDVYHIIVNHSTTAERSKSYWTKMLGQHCVVIDDYNKVSDTISDIVIANFNARVLSEPTNKQVLENDNDIVENVIIKPITKPTIETIEEEIL